jgi:hypothetical protein
MVHSTSTQTEVRRILSTCLFGLVAATNIGFITLPVRADVTSRSSSSNSATASNGGSVNQTTRQTNIMHSDGKGNHTSIQNSRISGSASGENNRIDQQIDQYSDLDRRGDSTNSTTRQNAQSDAVTHGTDNRIQHEIDQFIRRR